MSEPYHRTAARLWGITEPEPAAIQQALDAMRKTKAAVVEAEEEAAEDDGEAVVRDAGGGRRRERRRSGPASD